MTGKEGMGRTIRCLWVFAIALGIGRQALAEETIPEAKRAAIQELLQVTEAEKMAGNITEAMLQQMERSYPQLVGQLMPEIRESGDQEALRQKLLDSRARFSKRFRELYMQRIDFGQVVKQIYIPLYDKHFSEQELKDLIGFYRSASGKKALAVMPDLLRESMQRSSEVLNPQIMQIVRDIMQEEKALLIDKPAASPPPPQATGTAAPKEPANKEPAKP